MVRRDRFCTLCDSYSTRIWRLFSQRLVLFGDISDRVCVLCSRGLVALEGCEENRARVWRYAMSEGLSCCRQRDSHGYYIGRYE